MQIRSIDKLCAISIQNSLNSSCLWEWRTRWWLELNDSCFHKEIFYWNEGFYHTLIYNTSNACNMFVLPRCLICNVYFSFLNLVYFLLAYFILFLKSNHTGAFFSFSADDFFLLIVVLSCFTFRLTKPLFPEMPFLHNHTTSHQSRD